MSLLSALRNDLSGGTSEYKSLNNQRNRWIESQIGPRPEGLFIEGERVSGDPNAEYEWQQKFNQLKADWITTLPPEQQQQAVQVFSQHSSEMDTINKYGSTAAKAIIAASGAGAALTGAGVIGGAGAGAGSTTGLTGVDAAMADLAAAGGLTPASMGGAGAAAAGTAAGLGGAGAATGAAGGGLLSGAGNMLGGLSGSDWASILAGGAGLANSLKDPATAATPDYMALAKLQAELDQTAADRALSANRPNQVDAAGNTLTWTQDPTTGKWTQTQKLSAANQGLLDTSQQAQLDALRGVSSRGDFNYQGPNVMDPVGNSSDIQNAWMSLLKPERDISRGNEIQRLKNQGLTEDSPAFQRAMLRLDQGDTDAQNKALIAGTSEYGNQFNRSLQGRQQGFGEYQTDYNAPMQQYQGLMGIAAPSGNFGNFTNAQSTGGANVYGAGQDQYSANIANANAKNAASNNLTQGLFGLSGTIAKGGWGG